MHKYYCTYFDKNYLAKALSLFTSLERHENDPYTIFAVCLDELSRIILEKISPLNVILIPLHIIEKSDPELLVAKANRDLIEYYWTLTPSVVIYILKINPELELITYLDADLFFYSSPSPIFSELEDNSILIHEHRFSPRLSYLENLSGKYNVGLIIFKNDDIGKNTLSWWRRSCIDWCYLQFGDGKMGDQMYLNEWVARFAKVHILKNIGAGVAPWNHEQYLIRQDIEGDVTIDGVPLIFYHFHALEFAEKDIVIPAKHTHYTLNAAVIKSCYLQYINALTNAIHSIDKVYKGFAFGLVTKSPSIAQTFICTNSKKNHYGNIASSHAAVLLDGLWTCYCTDQFKESFDDRYKLPLLWPMGKFVNSCDDLLLQLDGLQISNEIKVIYIIGAHLFQESEVIFRLFKNVEKIYLFEAIPELCQRLNELFGSNPIIEIFPYAISDIDETAHFHVTSNSWESSSLFPLGGHLDLFPHVHEIGVIPVTCRKIDSVIDQHQLREPDMLFIDVQGAEYKIISSLSKRIKSYTKLIYTEASHEELYIGAQPLDKIIDIICDDYHYLGFAPLFNNTPTHGNALFVAHEHIQKIMA